MCGLCVAVVSPHNSIKYVRRHKNNVMRHLRALPLAYHTRVCRIYYGDAYIGNAQLEIMPIVEEENLFSQLLYTRRHRELWRPMTSDHVQKKLPL